MNLKWINLLSARQIGAESLGCHAERFLAKVKDVLPGNCVRCDFRGRATKDFSSGFVLISVILSIQAQAVLATAILRGLSTVFYFITF